MFYPGSYLGPVPRSLANPSEMNTDTSNAPSPYPATDVVLVSSDSVFFYVHSAVLLRNSSNRFNNLFPTAMPMSLSIPPPGQGAAIGSNGLGATPISPSTTHVSSPTMDTSESLPSSCVTVPSQGPMSANNQNSGSDSAESPFDYPSSRNSSSGSGPTDGNGNGSEEEPMTIIPLPESSEVLNVLLHTLYAVPCSHYNPTLPVILSSLSSLSQYGHQPLRYISSSLVPLYGLILSHAPSRPLDVYTFAAGQGLEELAVACSSHLLGLPLYSISDKSAMEMGPVYLKRLFFLHLGRVDALKVFPSTYEINIV